MSERREFVRVAQQTALSVAAALVSAARQATNGSIEPMTCANARVHSPTRTDERVEAQVLALRQKHPARGGHKIVWRLQDIGVESVPHASMVTHILHRHGLITRRYRVPVDDTSASSRNVPMRWGRWLSKATSH